MRLEARHTTLEHELSTYLRQIAESHGRQLEAIDPDDPFIEHGILDSLSLLDFVVALEKHYDIKIPGEEVVPEHFGSLAAVTTYLRERFGLRQPQ